MAQPNMGPRKLYSTRPPEDVAQAFEEEAASSGLPYSRLLADLVADRYGLQRPSERFRTKAERKAQARAAAVDAGQPSHPLAEPAPPRDLYSTRLPQDVAAAFEHEVATTGGGMPYTLFLADLLAARYQLPLPSLRVKPAREAQHGREVLPLDRAC